MTLTTFALDTVTAGEGAMVTRPLIPGDPKPGVLWVHGAAFDSRYPVSPYGRFSSLTDRITELGLTGLACDLGGMQWGNATAMSRLTAAYNYLQTRPGVKPGKVFLIGNSMGGLTALNWAAANPDKVAGIVTIIPVINLTDIVTNHRSLGGTDYAPLVNAGYAGGWSEAAYGATYNPRTIAATTPKLRLIPMQVWYGLSDTLCVPAETEAFAGCLPLASLIPLPFGHEEAGCSAVDHQLVADFITAHSA